MISITKKLKRTGLLMIAAVMVLTSCNDGLEQISASQTPVSSGLTLGETIAASPDDSLYNRLILRSGLTFFNDRANSFTMFVTNNAGMRIFVNGASSGAIAVTAPDATHSAFLNGLPVATAAGIVSYNTVPQKFKIADLPTTFPNVQMPTAIILPQTPPNPLVRMTIFPSKRTNFSYVNNLPLTAVDFVAANGIIHHSFSVATPPSLVLAQIIYGDPTLSLFTAAIARADSGQVGISGVGAYGLKLDSLLKFGVTNMTVLAPNNAAFNAIGITTAAQINALPVAAVRGIVAYHFLASSQTGSIKPDIRVFSVNFDPAPTLIKTLVNGAVPTHPGVRAQATFTGPAVTALTFTGVGPLSMPPAPPTPPFSGPAANAITRDRLAVNGIVHIIDRVLFPQ